MAPIDRLIERLEALGYMVESLAPAVGFWRQQDVDRWEAIVRKDDRLIIIRSLDTVTACARWGFTLEPDGPGTLRAYVIRRCQEGR